MANSWCMQCGEANRPTPAAGFDAEGEPACIGHMVERSKSAPVKIAGELCFCGRPARHTGRHIGSPAKLPPKVAQRIPHLAPPAVSKPKKTVPLQRKTSITEEEVTKAFPTSEPFIGDSGWRVPLASGGELMLMFRGDVFELLRNRKDMELMRGLIATIECRGELMYPFAEPHKNKKGEMVMTQFEKGFLSDMIDMLDEDQKIKCLTLAWSKRL